MKFDTRVVVRTAWGPYEVTTHELGEKTPKEVAAFLEALDEEVMLVNISLWNERKIEKMRGA